MGSGTNEMEIVLSVKFIIFSDEVYPLQNQWEPYNRHEKGTVLLLDKSLKLETENAILIWKD